MPKARTEPWVHMDKKNKSSVGAALSARGFGLFSCGSWLCFRWESAAPRWGLNKCVSMINPGLAPWAMQECRPCRAISVSDTKSQSISMHQHIRTNECSTTAIQSDNNPSHHQPSANPFGFIHYMRMGEPFRATLLQSPGWRECQRHEQNPG